MSDGRLFEGQQYDQQADLVIPFTEQMRDNRTCEADVIGDARTDVTPIDHESSKVRVWGVPTNALDSYFISYPGVTNINLPNELVSITTSYSVSERDGEDIHDAGAAFSTGTSISIRFSPSVRAQGSVSIIPDVAIDIKQTWGQNVPTKNFFFYLSGNPTTAQIITKVTTLMSVTGSVAAGVVTSSSAHGLSANQPFQFSSVTGGAGGITANLTYYAKVITDTTHFTYSATAGGAALAGHSASAVTVAPVISSWPSFRPATHTLTLTGGSVSASANADIVISADWSVNGNQSFAIAPYGGRSDGVSRETSLNVRSIQLPPTIHGAISISDTEEIGTMTVNVRARTPEIIGSGGAPSYDAVDNNPDPIEESLTARVRPTSFSATPGTSSIPTSGLYILDVQVDPYKWGYTRIFVSIIDFSFFA